MQNPSECICKIDRTERWLRNCNTTFSQDAGDNTVSYKRFDLKAMIDTHEFAWMIQRASDLSIPR